MDRINSTENHTKRDNYTNWADLPPPPSYEAAMNDNPEGRYAPAETANQQEGNMNVNNMENYSKWSDLPSAPSHETEYDNTERRFVLVTVVNQPQEESIREEEESCSACKIFLWFCAVIICIGIIIWRSRQGGSSGGSGGSFRVRKFRG